MLSLSADNVRMQATAKNKDEALTVLANILVADGLASFEYRQGLADREVQSATYLGQGIAIPHGTPDSRQYIKQTGVRLVHFPDGIAWNDAGDIVYLAVLICAQSDEHLSILQKLTAALHDDIAQKVKTASSADEIISLLSAKPKSLLMREDLVLLTADNDADTQFISAMQALKSAGAISSLFIPAHKPALLSDTVRCIILENQPQINTSALALVMGECSDAALAVVTANQDIDHTKLSALFDALMSDEAAALVVQGDRAGLMTLLGIETESSWPAASVTLLNAHGLHARPATALAKLATEMDGDIRVAVDGGAFVSAKSLTRLLSLGAVRGQTLTFIAEPQTDAAVQLDRLTHAVSTGLGEEVIRLDLTNVSASVPSRLADLEQAEKELLHRGERLSAISASGGLAVGAAYLPKAVTLSYPETADNALHEKQRLSDAISATKADIHAMIAGASSATVAQIFTAHVALLEDDEVLHGADAAMEAGSSAEHAWHGFIEALAKAQAMLGNALLAERAQDLRDVGQKVLLKLTGQSQAAPPDAPYVLIKQDLLPSDVANLDPARVAGIITVVGGASSHAAIVARALGIPALVGAGIQVLDIDNDESVLLDGGEGWFVIAPDETLIDECRSLQRSRQELKRQAIAHAHLPAITTDGHRVEVAANIGNVGDTANAVANGAEGIGLLRTELVFMAHSQMPTVDMQIQDYEQVFDALEGRPLVVRLLDIGGDKALPYLAMPHEENPFLGLRGSRLLLKYPTLLKTQLTALIIASRGRDLRIMFPMIGRLEEWRAARKILDEVLVDYPHDSLQVGIMLEVPSAAAMAYEFAKEVDFFSIGTNDLTQYVLAIDRGHPILSKDADGLHPAVLRLIEQTVEAAHAEGKWVGVCGELASDAKAIPVLIGLGVDELSMSGSAIALAKAQIRTLNLPDAKDIARRALQCESADAVRALNMPGGA